MTKRAYLVVAALLLAPALMMTLVAQSPQEKPAFAKTASSQQTQPSVPSSVKDYLRVASRSSTEGQQALNAIEKNWHPGSAVMLIEAVRFSRFQLTIRKTFEILKRKTGQDFGRDHQAWYQWIWNQKYEPHPQYAQFKSAIYAPIDRRFTEYFEQTDNATIRLDEIRWGGVKRDGIPPLKNPEMIQAKQARYLADTDVVFGIKINGDARCYPKRILAWHEMFKDHIGNVSVCAAY